MKNVDFYIDKAIEVQGYKSDRQLSFALGYKGNNVTYFRTKKAWPSDETMEKLAALAEIDPEIALIDLSIWRTSGDAQKAYANILHKLTNAATIAIAVIVISLGFNVPYAHAGNTAKVSSCQSETVYYG